MPIDYTSPDRKAIFEAEDYLSPEDGYPERSIEEWFKPHILPKVLQYLQPTDSVMDVGCAHGYITRILANHCRYAIGVDLAENRIKYASLYEIWGKLSFRQWDATTLPFALPFPVEIVYTSAAIQHIPLADKPRAIKNIALMTAIGGKMLMFDHRAEETIRDDFVGSYNEEYWKQFPEWKLLNLEFVTGDTWFYLFERV